MSASDRFAYLGFALLVFAVGALYMACTAPIHSTAVFCGGFAFGIFVSVCLLMIFLHWQSKVEARTAVAG
jgi:hypothetical protein